jgi:A/G-specific adenine glycosylase
MDVSISDEFSRRLLLWWELNQREYPWRSTREPYRILVAEFLLHRTRADQVVPLYEQFIATFSDVEALAGASRAELHKMLFSAGLRWRTDLLLETARAIHTNYAGEIPVERQELESLPGVGPYIAAAVRTFAHGIPDAILDTNTVRIAARVFGFPLTDSSRRKKSVVRLMHGLLDRERPREFNLALLDLGALVCRAREPLCSLCPVQPLCAYGQQQL